MKILLAATPIPGHVDLMLAMARMLASSVHEVRFATATAYRARVEATGARFLPFQGRADVDLPDVDGISASRLQSTGMAMPQACPERLLFDAIPDQYATLQAALMRYDADIVIADSHCFGTLPLLLDRSGARPRVMHCGVSCLKYRVPGGTPAYTGNAVPTAPADRRHQSARGADGDAPGMISIQQYLNARLAEAGAGPLHMDALTAAITLPDAYAQPSVPEFEHCGRGLPPSVHFLGAPQPTSGGALPDWAYELDGSRHVVLVTEGTIGNGELGQLIAPTLEAMADEADVLVLASTGDRPVHAMPGGIPPNARITPSLPFGWLMPRVDAVVSQGGYGTVNLALKHGVPLVVAASTEGESDVAARVAWSGTGIDLRCGGRSAADFRAAIRAVLDEQRYRAAACGMAMAFARIDTRLSLLRLIRETVLHRPPDPA
jgi:UDP:flavonoid glycosyltransferase YjiC (YdhE family)